MQNQVISKGNDFQTYSIGGGLEFNEKQMLDFLNNQYEAAKLELKDLFTTNEAWLIVNSLYGLPSSFEQTAKIIVSGYVRDIVYFGTKEELCEVDGEKLLNKLHRLTEFQAYSVLNMVREFIEIELDEESNHDSEDLINEIFMVSKKESIIHDEICSGKLSQCEENCQNTNLNLQMELAEEKLGHLRTILEISFGINIVIGLNAEEYSLFLDCDNCGGYHLLETYSIEEAVALDAETEADDLIETYFID